MYTYITNSPDETERVGYSFGIQAVPNDIYCLRGELGAGKTVFAKGFAAGLSVPNDSVVSPTYTIVCEYAGRLPFYHFDVYRCTETDMEPIGFDDYLYAGGVTLIEWADRIESILPQSCVWIDIRMHGPGENARIITEKRVSCC